MQRISAVFQMYFIIKYNVFNKYIINVTTTEINTCKKIFEFGQREVISFFTLVTNKGVRKGNNKITELRTILQRESQNS